MNILCENPVIIRNPELPTLLCKYGYYITPTYDKKLDIETRQAWKYSFPTYQFSPRRMGVTIDNYEQFQVVDTHTGQSYSMFFAVPCGHCLICRNKKAREWSFRAICETNTSKVTPLFITLTYNSKHLPECGIYKEEVQLFLKRLRIHLDRDNIEHELRYVAVGEYGSQSKRPHYHMILWNFPLNNAKFPTLHSALHYIENAWKVSTGEYNKDGSPVTESLGFCYCCPVIKGGINYVMKYMRKQHSQPTGKNPVFFLSSRRHGGIGSAYARKFINHYRNNPSDVTMSAVDPFTGLQVTMPMPSYFRNIYFPTMSKVLHKQIRDNYKKLCALISERASMYSLVNIHDNFALEQEEQAVFRKYYFLPRLFSVKRNKELVRLYKSMSRTQLHDLYQRNRIVCNDICRYLMMESYDESYVAVMDELKAKRKSQLSLLYSDRPDLDVHELVYDLHQQNQKIIEREKI